MTSYYHSDNKVFPLAGVLVLFFHLLLSVPAYSVTVWRKGVSAYTIVVADEASASEQTAAHELQHYVRRISGVTLPMSSTLSIRTPCIYIGYNSRVAALTGAACPSEDDEGFTYLLAGNDIVVYGGSRRGTMYGVFALLENELGVRWYTRDCTVVPRMSEWTVKHMYRAESPAIPYRYTMYYGCADNAAWSAHNRNNFTWGVTSGKYGGTEACLGAHTLGEFLPADEFAATHPEYFALRGGKRVCGGQPCLSHPDVLHIVTRRVLSLIARRPGFLYYDVSQLDNQLYCECERCRNIECRFGNTHSGIMLWFVNQVADEVAKVCPGAMLCTFAYQYTRQAPVGIRPRPNVTVRLCDIECCFAHPLESCVQNRSFMADLRDWSRLTDRLFIWDYVVNFHNYIAPYPNFDVLGSNIQTFARLGVSTVLEQGQRESDGGEWAELKAWVIARLLWNPHLDALSLADTFITGYYGTAAPYVRQYFNLCRRQVRADTHIYQNGDETMSIYSDTFIRSGTKILRRAMEHSNDAATRSRVERLLSQMLDIHSKLNPVRSCLDGTRARYDDYLKRTQPFVREGKRYE